MTRTEETIRERPVAKATAAVKCPICPLLTNTIGITGHWNWHVANGDADGVICCYCAAIFGTKDELLEHRTADHGKPKSIHPRRSADSVRAARYAQVESWVKLPYAEFRRNVEDRSLWHT